MPDIIHLLPDSVANQIAAGEVVQRPASVVKELMENAIDAGATEIQLIIKDAGKTLIQVIDNGKGMSETDARLSFERHATSKLKEAKDLFAIRTMGFRGEALASIAAVAQVEMKTRRPEDELGTIINIEGTQIKAQEACQAPCGTSIAVKNLFFNIPARRQFLKSDSVEKKHIAEEFYRVALVHPDIKFCYFVDDKMEITAEKSNFKQRIVSLFGKQYNQRLIPLEQSMAELRVAGFVGKPEFALKSRSEQYFFVNNRFIKHPYLHHAVDSAFKELLPEKNYPSYFIHFEIDPKNIDINIHPTKTEIKFIDEKLIYGVLRSTVRKAIGMHNITPSLDFGPAADLEIMPPPPGYIPQVPKVSFNPNYNPFQVEKTSAAPAFHGIEKNTPSKAYFDRMETLYQSDIADNTNESTDSTTTFQEKSKSMAFQWQNKYIVTHLKSGLLVINQQLAHERILYEQYMQQLENKTPVSQHKLFPQTLELSPADADTLKDILQEVMAMGWEIEEFGKNAFIIHATPIEVKDHELKAEIDSILEQYKQNLLAMRTSKRANIAAVMARQHAIKTGSALQLEEMQNLINSLFACELPGISPQGKRCYTIIQAEEIEQKLEQK